MSSCSGHATNLPVCECGCEFEIDSVGVLCALPSSTTFNERSQAPQSVRKAAQKLIHPTLFDIPDNGRTFGRNIILCILLGCLAQKRASACSAQWTVGLPSVSEQCYIGSEAESSG